MISRPVHDRPAPIRLPRRYRIEIELMAVDDQLSRFGRLAWRACLAGAAVALVALVVVRTISRPAPVIARQVTDFNAVLTPDTWREWMRPHWLKGPSDVTR